MNQIVLLVFLLAVVPYLGLPRSIDQWIVLVLVSGLGYSIYTLVKKHNITFVVPVSEDDFLQDHNVIDNRKVES